MDTHAFASLAQVPILLVPVGAIPYSTFSKFASEIRSFDSIRLGDIPEGPKDERARFMPKTLSTGHLHLSFPTHPPPFSHLSLSLLRPSHFPLAVIGIASCSRSESLASILAQFNATILSMFPADGMYPLARNCFVFEENDDGSSNISLGESPPGVVVFPSLMGNRKLYIGTLLADLCSQILGEFGALIERLESPVGNEYLNASLLPSLPSLSEMPASLNGLPPLPSHNSQPEISKTGFSTPAVMKRNSSLGVPTVKKRLSGIGAASSHGRLFKVTGDLFLLSGRTEDASIWYNEALQLFKPSVDSIWQAATLEGLATISVLDAWSSGYGLQTSSSATKEPWSDISEKLNQATNLYFRYSSSDGEPHYDLLSYLYCCCVLRHASLLFSVWSAKGWGPLAFTTMLHSGPTPYLPPTLMYDEKMSWSTLERLSLVSGISRNHISTIIAQVHGPWLLHLGARERIAILETMASLYSCIGYPRKEAYILREVLGCILDLIVCGREEETSSYYKGGVSERSAIQGIKANGRVGVRLSESVAGNDSILKLLQHVCQVLGVKLNTVNIVDLESDSTSAATSTVDEEEYLDSFGWPELQQGIIREAVAVAEALPDFLAVAQYALSSLKALQDVLSPGDQFHLVATAARALMTARRRGTTQAVEYWSGKPVLSISIASLPLMRLPIEKPMSALQPRLSGVNAILTGDTDPFLYNPRKSSRTKGKTLVVQSETLEFVVMLQNPYVFDLELQSLSLSVSGVAFDSQPTSVVVPARSFQQAILTGRALETGTLVIRGCVVQAPGTALKEFLLPLSSDEEMERAARRRSTLQCESGRFKYSGLDAFPWEQESKRRSKALSKPGKPMQFLECQVVPEQPLLRIRRTSVTHGALMLYDGEMSSIKVTFENISALPIDFLRLVFDDSTIAPAQRALAEGDLSVFETYETEYDLIHRPVFSWEQNDSITVAPGKKVTVMIKCFGKVGCTDGTIHASYSYVHRPQIEDKPPPQMFHTRQLSFPLMVTVYHMLECNGMDILPYPSHLMEDTKLKSNLFVDGEGSWCLFSIDVRNTYGTPFEVSIERAQEGVSKAETSVNVPPGSTSRIVIPLKKFLLSSEKTSQPIPTLSDRQFVVAQTKLTQEEETLQRELFWYREELFKCLHCRWKEAGGTRFGDLSLRQQRMTLTMLDTLRTESAMLSLSLVRYNSERAPMPVPHRAGKYYAPATEMIYLLVKVTNLSRTSLIYTVDIGIDPVEHVIFDGVLNDIAIGRLESNESKEMEMALCFLSYGRFEIVASARCIGSSNMQGQGIGRLSAMVSASE
ncbi:hypothetical protein K435DRAFT_972612 [Dendrothele bispora CBS 962.96]|uniref:Trs120-domain-containing protein n=1 Tax=Dendrothele bispora (strain CBS 962.96) TaxID=1314807 RepID=A0A4S8KXT6_DENBC|nr:hypothetical protein K435DRAFT_972612 [Dendrothele bispora CBS 962.96]